jgi:hypothetical protein
VNNGDTAPDPSAHLQSCTVKRREIDLSIEVVLLVVGGVYFLLFGVLLFLIDKGMLPYSKDSTYGLFVVLVSLQIITMGRTPFGDFLRSWLVVIIGLVTAIIGTLAIFYPGYLSTGIQILAGLIVLFTGVLGMLQLFTSRDKARIWMTVPGILQQLTLACVLVYSIEIVLGVITLFPGIVPNPVTALLCLVFGISLLFLARCIHVSYQRYRKGDGTTDIPASPQKGRSCLLREASLTVENSFNTYEGCLLILLGFLVLFNILGSFPSYNSEGHDGILLVLTSLQLLALGQFVGGQITRSWPVFAFGILCASAGIFSCVVPGILSGIIVPLLGLQNIITGVILLATQIILPALYGIRHPPAGDAVLSPVLRHLKLVLLLTGIATIVFGINLIAPVFLPGLLGMFVYFIFLPLLIIVMGLLTLITVIITQKLRQGAATPS